MFEVPTTFSEIKERSLFKVIVKEESLPKYINPNTFELDIPSPYYAEVITTPA